MWNFRKGAGSNPVLTTIKKQINKTNTMSDFISRLYDEKNQLEEKVGKLKAFLYNTLPTGSHDVDDYQQALLHIQYSAMETYLKCLNERIVRLEPKSNT